MRELQVRIPTSEVKHVILRGIQYAIIGMMVMTVFDAINGLHYQNKINQTSLSHD